MNRQEHLVWAKERALYYCDRGDIPSAISSFFSDLHKHSELREHYGMQLAVNLLSHGHLKKIDQVKKFILDFN